MSGQVRFRQELQRQRLDGSQVHGDVLAGHAVSSGGAPDEAAVVVHQFDREPVELGFGRVLHGPRAEFALHAFIEGEHFLLIGDRIQAEHWFLMLDLVKFVERRRADTLGGGVGRDEFRIGGFQLH